MTSDYRQELIEVDLPSVVDASSENHLTPTLHHFLLTSLPRPT